MDFPDDTDRPPWGVHAAIVAGTLLVTLFSVFTTGVQLALDTSLRCSPDGSEGTKLAGDSPRARLICGDDPGEMAARPAVSWALAGVAVLLGLVTLVTWFVTHRHRVLGTMLLATVFVPFVLLVGVRLLPGDCTEETARSASAQCERGWYDD